MNRGMQMAGGSTDILIPPSIILVIYAFNSGRLTTVWAGFSLRWFVQIAQNSDIRDTAINSVIIAICATIASTAIAIAGALALERGRLFLGRGPVSGMIMMPLVVPEIVVAITTLIFFSSLGMHYGLGNLIIAHTVFCIPFAVLPIQARLRESHALYQTKGEVLRIRHACVPWKRQVATSTPASGGSSDASPCPCSPRRSPLARSWPSSYPSTIS